MPKGCKNGGFGIWYYCYLADGGMVTPRKACWATSLGGCGGGISGEHVLSKGLWDGRSVQISGSPWTRGEPRSIGLKGLKSNILCRRHNSQLSPVDAQGIRAFRGIRDIDNWLAASRRRFTGRQSTLDMKGHLLERWFLKSAINLFVVASQRKQWPGGQEPRDPPAELVRAAFGQAVLKYPNGLYNWAGLKVGEQVELKSEIAFVPLYRGTLFVGAQFTFHGLNFLVWFCDSQLPWEDLRAFYRHMGGELEDAGNQGRLTVSWPDGWRRNRSNVS